MTLTNKVKEAVCKQTTFLSGMVEPELEEYIRVGITENGSIAN